jgi:hypothetical protein
VTDLGHDEPTLILANRSTRPAAKPIGRCAQRMIVENMIEDGIDFFHMATLSSAAALTLDCDLQLSHDQQPLSSPGLRARSGLSARQVPAPISRDFVDVTATVTITGSEIQVPYHKRAQYPLLIAAGFATTDAMIPRLGGRGRRLVFE